MTTYSHGGDVGDLLAALPTIRQLGPGVLRLVPAPYVRERFTLPKVERLRRLLVAQPYITGLEYAAVPAGIDLDLWRHGMTGRYSIAEEVARAFSVPLDVSPWIVCTEPLTVAPVVVHRSPRYHGQGFPWRSVREQYHDRAVFLGLPDEHAAWEREYGPIPYYPTPDWWELAKVVAGAELYLGNQSGPLWLALGLGQRVVCEECACCANCRIDRPGAVYVPGGAVELPELSG